MFNWYFMDFGSHLASNFHQHSPKINKKCVSNAASENTWKSNHLSSKVYPFRAEKYSKPAVLSFKITLPAYQQRSRHNDPQGPHFDTILIPKVSTIPPKGSPETILSSLAGHLFLLESFLEPHEEFGAHIMLVIAACAVARISTNEVFSVDEDLFKRFPY